MCATANSIKHDVNIPETANPWLIIIFCELQLILRGFGNTGEENEGGVPTRYGQLGSHREEIDNHIYCLAVFS